MSNNTDDEIYWIKNKTLSPPLHQKYDNKYQSDFDFIETQCSIIQIGYSLQERDRKVFLKFVKNKKGKKSQINNEIMIMKNISHYFLMNLEHTFIYKQYTCIVTPMSPYGTLQDLFEQNIKTYHKPFSESVCKDIMYQLLLAVKYLHKINIIHRDIKPDNILVFNWYPHNPHIKLSDFGLSIYGSDDLNIKGYIGTLEFIPPEVYNQQNYSKSGDIWSCGILLFFLLTRRLPFPKSKCLKELKRCVKEGRLNLVILLELNISKDAYSLINEMLQFYPEDRITAKKALKHPWFNEVAGKYQCFDDDSDGDGKRTNEFESDIIKKVDPYDTILRNEIQ